MPDRKNERLIFLFLLAGALLLFPIVSLADRPVQIFGFPALYVYLFSAWAGIIILIYLTVSRTGGADLPEQREQEDSD